MAGVSRKAAWFAWRRLHECQLRRSFAASKSSQRAILPLFPDRSPVEGLAAPVGHAIRRTRQWLLDQQDDDGSWCAELEGDTILESETILMLAFLGREDTPLARRAAAYLVRKQLPEGGWAKFPGGRLDISGSVKAYFALKLTGHDPAAEFMERAAAGDPRPWRGRRGQQFYAVLPGPLGTDFLRTLPRRSAGDGPLAEMVPREPVRHERLVADDRRAAFDRGRLGARASDRTRARHPRIVPQRTRALAAAPLPGAAGWNGLAELGPFLSRDQSAVEVRPAQGSDVLAKAGHRSGQELDAGPLPEERRPGRDLSAGGFQHRGPEGPGLCRRQPGGRRVPAAIGSPGHR